MRTHWFAAHKTPPHGQFTDGQWPYIRHSWTAQAGGYCSGLCTWRRNRVPRRHTSGRCPIRRSCNENVPSAVPIHSRFAVRCHCQAVAGTAELNVSAEAALTNLYSHIPVAKELSKKGDRGAGVSVHYQSRIPGRRRVRRWRFAQRREAHGLSDHGRIVWPAVSFAVGAGCVQKLIHNRSASCRAA